MQDVDLARLQCDRLCRFLAARVGFHAEPPKAVSSRQQHLRYESCKVHGAPLLQAYLHVVLGFPEPTLNPTLAAHGGWCLTGSLPEAWGETGSFPALRVLALSFNSLTGTVPASYFGTGSFRRLGILALAINNLSGTLPSVLPLCGLCQPKKVSATLAICMRVPRAMVNPCVPMTLLLRGRLQALELSLARTMVTVTPQRPGFEICGIVPSEFDMFATDIDRSLSALQGLLQGRQPAVDTSRSGSPSYLSVMALLFRALPPGTMLCPGLHFCCTSLLIAACFGSPPHTVCNVLLCTATEHLFRCCNTFPAAATCR